MQFSLIQILGITTFTMALITAVFGLRAVVKIDVKIRRKVHIVLAVITLCIAAVHGGIVFYTKYIM